MPGGLEVLVAVGLYLAVAASPVVGLWIAVRLVPRLVERVAEARRARRQPRGESLETVVARLRSLRHELRDVPPSTNVRAQAVAAAYDGVLVDTCAMVGIDPPLAHADDTDRPFARLLTEAVLEDAGIALDPPGSVTAG